MDSDFDKHMKVGGQAAADGRLAVAEDAFRQAYQINQKSADACRNLAAVLHLSSKLDDAAKMWRAALDIDPTSGAAYFNLGLIFMTTKDFEAAKSHFNRALEIKPALADAAFNLGRIAYHEGDRAKARDLFARCIKVQPEHIKAHTILVQVLTELGLESEAIAAGQRAIKALEGLSTGLPKESAEMLMHMANAHRRLGELKEASQWYSEVVKVDPDNAIAHHLLAAAEGTLTDKYAKAYTIKSFDTFAQNFDAHLLNILSYRSPDILAADLAALRPQADTFATCLDLGCGTGLMASALSAHFKIPYMVGIDLSKNMLDEARSKNLYQELLQEDIAQAMSVRTDEVSLIVSADVFIYVGEVSEIFEHAARLLSANGIFAFSIEVSPKDDVELAPTGRYRHKTSYIRELASKNGMVVLREREGLIRKDARDKIFGTYFYLEKREPAL